MNIEKLAHYNLQKTNEAINTQAEMVAVVDQNGDVYFESRKIAMQPERNLKRIIASMVATYTDTNGEVFLLLSKRAPDKKEYPNHYSFASSGHVNIEDIVDGHINFEKAIRRESREEIGLNPQTITILDTINTHEAVAPNQTVEKLIVVGHTNLTNADLQAIGTSEEVTHMQLLSKSQITQNIELLEKGEKTDLQFTPVFVQTMKQLLPIL